MNQNISTEWSKTERIIFRLSFCYLVFYFVFLDDFVVRYFPVLNYVHAPLQNIFNSFVGLVNRLFLHKEYGENIYKGFGDTSWSCIAILSCCILAVIATVVWTIFDNRKNYLRLFTLLQTYA